MKSFYNDIYFMEPACYVTTLKLFIFVALSPLNFWIRYFISILYFIANVYM